MHSLNQKYQTGSTKNVSSPITANLSDMNDFYKFLDEKTINYIKNTNIESLKRISDDVVKAEYDIDGAVSIIETLK